jgi:putative nucleotidyltransferase with HDIG domain
MSLIDSIGSAQEFATLPPVATKVLALLENESADIREIVSVIETDPSLTLKILQMANSPLYAVRGSVSSVHQSVLTLGLNRVANIVLSVSIFSKFIMLSRSASAQYLERFWWHSSCTGMVAKALAAKIKRSFKEAEFIGGILHDIGKMAMIQFDPANYGKMLELMNTAQITDKEAEMQIFGVDHEAVGAVITRLWKLPENLQAVVAHHSDPASLKEHRELTAVIRVADILCEVWGAGIDEGIREMSLGEENAWKVLCSSYPDLAALDIEMFTFELEEEFRSASAFLNLIVKDPNARS